MKSVLSVIVSTGLVLGFGSVFADGHEAPAEDANVAYPMEMFACNYNDGKGPADLDAATKAWNKWADKQGIDDYSAWTLVPYYYSGEQDFDVLWFGAADKAKTLGRVQDSWVATGGKEAEGFAEAITCDTHAAYSVLMMKQPPESLGDSGGFVVTFSDCNTSEGVTFDDLYTPMIEWGKYGAENDSKAGHWVFFPAYGGGKEEFDFKWVEAFENLEDLGADWDQLNEAGWQKANELFQGKVSCDSSRTYFATARRTAESND